MKKIILIFVVPALVAAGCARRSPAGANQSAGLALQLRVAPWTLLQPGRQNFLARALARSQITRVEIFVIFEKDTLTRATVPIAGGAAEFSASLEVPAGEDRRIVVEAWDDLGSEGEAQAGLVLRGVQTNVTIVADLVQTVSLTLYPVPIAGRRVVLAMGSASGTPGSSGNFAPITLVSADSLSGLQFDLSFDAAILSPQSLVPDPALVWNSVESNLVNGGRALRIIMFDSDGRRLPAYHDPAVIARADFRVNAEAAVGAGLPLVISSALALDANRNQLEVAAVQDTFHVVAGK